jgi:PAS domain S-box-containing protein
MTTEGRSRLAHAMAAATSGTWEWDIGLDKLWIDERFAELYGLDATQARSPLPTSTFFLRIHPDDKARMRIAVAGMLGGSENFSKEFRIGASDGSVHWMHGRGQTILGANDEPLRFTGLLVDVTDRKRTEERLRIAQKAGGVGTFEYIDGFATVAVSEEFCRLLGLLPASALPVPTINRLVYQGDGPLIPEHVGEDDIDLAGEFLVTHGVDAQPRWIARRGEIVREGPGGGYRLVGVVYDISAAKSAERELRELNVTLEARVQSEIDERLGAQEALRQAQKMEAVGQLTGGIAHDFNNVLQVIGGNLQLLTRDVTGNLRAEQRLQTATAAVARGSRLASQLLAFGRRQPLAPKVSHLGRLVHNVDDMLRRALGDGVEIETIISGGLWNTFVDVVQVENALLNLAINARDAMAGQGKLTIEVGNAFLDDEYAARHAKIDPGQYVVIAVTDTGCGIPAEIIEQVFEPFFTTKPEGQGTGLGLSMVYGFVKQSGGHIKIYSEPGHGTTVRMYLPRTREPEDVEIDTETGPPTGGTETVLVVEDDEEVRRTTIDLLSELGYRVLRAKDAQSALAVVESGISIDLIFTDVVMPGPSRSTELARQARERLPSTAILFTSGYTENSIVHGGRLDEGVELLSKPYTRDALARKVRHVLRKRSQPASSDAGPRVAKCEPSAASVPKLKLLLVEDEVMIRISTADILGKLGHAVTEAANGTQALELLKKERFDVIIADVSLPGMRGDELAARAIELQPQLRVIFATGYGLPATGAENKPRNAVTLQKPYDEHHIVDALKAVTSAGPPQRHGLIG